MSNGRPQDHITRRRIVLELAESDAVVVRQDVEIPTDGDSILTDLFYPPGLAPVVAERLPPAVVLVAGYPDEGMQRVMGCRFKDMGSSSSWARAIAASGMVAVTYVNTDPAKTLDALVSSLENAGASLGINGSRLGLWASSGNVPVALSRLARRPVAPVRCLAACYGYLMDLDGGTAVADAARQFRFHTPLAGAPIDALATDVPILFARAGQDEMPGLNASADYFISRALKMNLPVSVVNHPSGQHAFDLLDDNEASRSTIRQVLAFLQRSLDVD